MKTLPLITPARGGVLVPLLLSVIIMGISIATYLGLVSSHNRMTARSRAWNSSMPVLEAGIEEALTQIHYNVTNLSLNGWVLSTGVYTKERIIGTSKYYVSISTNLPPVIYSYGYAQLPLSTNYLIPPRTVRVTTTNDPLFKKGLVAKGSIDLVGNNVKTDSFDSSDPAKSTGGVYDSSKAQDNGDVATNSSLIDTLDVWNADIYGHVSTGPGGNVKIGPNGSVGDKAWHAAGTKGLESGYFADDMNVSFPDVSIPTSALWFTPTSGNLGGTNYEYLLTGGSYQISGINMTSSKVMFVSGNSVLYVTGSLSLKGSASIKIASGVTLTIYAGGDVDIGGNGVSNGSGNAANFYLYGLPTSTSISMSGNAAFTGVIYAPSADLTLGGGGSSDYDFVGASISNTVKLNGHYKFHYDESLRKFGPTRDYVVATWNEI